MKKGSVMAIKRRKRKLICCKGGTIWLTVPGVIKDIILKQGDSYRVLTGKKIVVQAMLDCSFEIQ